MYNGSKVLNYRTHIKNMLILYRKFYIVIHNYNLHMKLENLNCLYTTDWIILNCSELKKKKNEKFNACSEKKYTTIKHALLFY